MTNEIKQDIQLAILGKSLISKDVCNKMLEAVSIEKIVFTGKCQDIYFAIANSIKDKGVCDAFTVIETLNECNIKDSVSIVRSAIDESKKLTDEDVMIEIKKIVLPYDDDNKLFTDTERLKIINNELLEAAAECIANKHFKKIDVGKKIEGSYIVRLKGGLSAVFQKDSSPVIYLVSGDNINRFPMSYKFVEDLYNEQNGKIDDYENDNVEEVPTSSTTPAKPKSFFEKFLK